MNNWKSKARDSLVPESTWTQWNQNLKFKGWWTKKIISSNFKNSKSWLLSWENQKPAEENRNLEFWNFKMHMNIWKSRASQRWKINHNPLKAYELKKIKCLNFETVEYQNVELQKSKTRFLRLQKFDLNFKLVTHQKSFVRVIRPQKEQVFQVIKAYELK